MAKSDKVTKAVGGVKLAKTVKAKKAQAEGSPVVIAAPVPANEPVVLKLDELTVLKLGKLSAQIRAASSELAMQSAHKAALLKQIDPQNKLEGFDKKILALHGEYSSAKRDYIDVVEQVKLKLGIDLKEYTYD